LLGWQIPPALNQQFAAQKPAFDGAYKHYLQGQGYLYRFDHGDNINKALASFQAAIAIDSNYGDAYVGLAEAQLRNFIETQNTDLLMSMANTVIQLEKIDGGHPLLSYLQGELKFNQGEYNNAVKLFEKSISLQSSFLKAYIGLSKSFVQLGELPQAEKTLLTAYNLMPNNSAVLLTLGAFHYRHGNYNRAIKYFEFIALQAPNNYIAYLNISACHYLNGNIDKAIVAAQQALTIQKNSTIYSNLGTYYFILKNYEQAVEAFEQMISLNDSDYINWGNLADAYRFANNYKYLKAFNEAIPLAEEALLLNPNNKNAIASLGYYYANLENVEKAIFYAKQISKKDTGSDIFLIAAAYARLNIKPAAINYLSLAINNNYSTAEIANSPLFESLKSEPEYLKLMKEY